MSLTLVQSAAQPAQPQVNLTPAQADHTKLLEMVTNHISAASRISDIDDLRYFDMRDLEQVRINLHLALELIELLKRRAPLD